MCENVEIVVLGNPNESYTCITADTRPYPWHGWERAALHIYRMKDLPYFVQVESFDFCKRVVEACESVMKRPRRDDGTQFGWGQPIHPGDKRARIKGIG